MYIQKFLNSDTGKYLMSILLGLGLATLFREVCKGEHCVRYIATPISEIQDKVFKYNEKCYQYTPESGTCKKNIKTLEINKKD